MMFQRTFKYTLVTAAGLALSGLPLPAGSQALPAPATEPPQMMEEVIVLGERSLADLKLEVDRAEDELYELFNSLTTDDDLEIRCTREAPVGSHIKQRVCQTKRHRELIGQASRDMMMGQPYVYPAAEIRHTAKRLLTHMTETALKQPEMLEALDRATEARQHLQSERKRRCEGESLFCW